VTISNSSERASSSNPAVPAMDAETLAGEMEALGNTLGAAKGQIARVIYGQEAVVEQCLVAILAGGHALLVGLPGLGKTLLVETLGQVLGLTERRVQFTPDLMPADILGSEVLEEGEKGRRAFRFVPGPVFAQLLMADEINRASPRTQSALLQAMQEGRVSVAGQYHPLPRPFHVLATQNPIEQEGTYPLPEAQLDRFLLEVDIGYPDEASEREIMLRTTGLLRDSATAAFTGESLMAAQALVRRVPVSEGVVEAILRLVRSGRPESSEIALVMEHVSWGPGPRASQAFMLAARARALLHGRLSPSVDDVLALAKPILRHRMALSFSARAEGVTLDHILEAMTEPLR